MADAIAKARGRLNEVIDRAAQVRGTRQQGQFDESLDAAQYTEWRMSAKTVVKLLDPGGHHKDEFEKIWEDASGDDDPDSLDRQLGVLKALREDFDGGYLSDVRGIVRAEVFADFMEQARHLFDEGYWQPVPVIVGSVLEDHMRKLCAKYVSIVLPSKPKLDWMNSELAKAKEYGVLEQKQVTVWADIRNSAAHGKWSEYKAADVEAMLRDVPRFLIDHKA
jgi:hypothetical protein